MTPEEVAYNDRVWPEGWEFHWCEFNGSGRWASHSNKYHAGDIRA